MQIKYMVGSILYHFLAKHLPRSYSGVKLGQKQLRQLCGKMMLEHCGNHVNIEKNALFSKKVSLGDYSGIGVNAKINGRCTIGSYVMMGEDCTIISRNHQFSRTDIPMMEQGFDEDKPVVIGNDVWIGDRVMILPGVHIGDGAIVGAGSVVTHSIPAGAIAVGNPARVIRNRNS